MNAPHNQRGRRWTTRRRDRGAYRATSTRRCKWPADVAILDHDDEGDQLFAQCPLDSDFRTSSSTRRAWAVNLRSLAVECDRSWSPEWPGAACRPRTSPPTTDWACIMFSRRSITPKVSTRGGVGAEPSVIAIGDIKHVVDENSATAAGWWSPTVVACARDP